MIGCGAGLCGILGQTLGMLHAEVQMTFELFCGRQAFLRQFNLLKKCVLWWVCGMREQVLSA